MVLEKNGLSPAAQRLGPFFAATFLQIDVERAESALCWMFVLCCVNSITTSLSIIADHIISYSHFSSSSSPDHIQSSSLFVYCVNQHLVWEEGDEKVHLVGEDRHQALRDPCPHLEQVRKAVTWTTGRPLRIKFKKKDKAKPFSFEEWGLHPIQSRFAGLSLWRLSWY